MSILIRADHNRRISIPGVTDPVRRPVDIDPSVTGFTNLRTLRIYQFDQDSVVEGHAEEDEVFIVVLAGAIELTMNALSPITLKALDGAGAGFTCAAYLPPGGVYKLVSQNGADVAYARATPSSGRSPRSFVAESDVFLEETSYAERLRFRLMLFEKQHSEFSFLPVKEPDAMCEALVYVRSIPSNGVSGLDSWDTVALAPGENPKFTISAGSAALALVVMAV